MGDLVTPDWKLVADRLWAMLAARLTPLQLQALAYIERDQPTTRELAESLNVSEAQAGNITRKLYDEGFLSRDQAGRSYRWRPAFPFPFTLRDRLPIVLSGEAAERALEILARRGKAKRVA
jgi:DNA-binding IclR family transcriptional regulator